METGKMINRISNRLRRRSHAVQASVGIGGSQGNILNYIIAESQNRSVYQKDIEREFGLRPSTATECLNALEKNELICRIPEEKDGRYKKIVFTEKAHLVKDTLRGEITETEAILLRGISKKEQAEFMRIADIMLKNLDSVDAKNQASADDKK